MFVQKQRMAEGSQQGFSLGFFHLVGGISISERRRQIGNHLGNDKKKKDQEKEGLIYEVILKEINAYYLSK